MRDGIKDVVHIAGGQAALARQLGVSQQAVSKWVQRGFAPVNRVVEIEAQFGVPRHRLIDPKLRDLVDMDDGGGV